MPLEVGPTFAGPPKKFGRYEVVRELGKGAMGVVYLGRDPVIGRLVALKTIRAAAEDDHERKEFSERFLREAQAAGTLSHPNIVTVHDVGEDEETETSFIAMEYVEGKNLKQLLREKTTFSFDRIAEIIVHVAEALDYAHRRGIVHRDVKPANIIITPDGAVKITDFGIAKIETSSLTETGQFLGTPNYMSPEQVTGETVDGRSDLFSLGVVLYELLTRKKPFMGDNLTSISYKIVHEDFKPAETYDANIPPELSALLVRALAKDPAGRFQRGSDFVQALSEFRARLAEREMLRDLGAMVAEAENLGRISTVESPPSAAPTLAPAPSPPVSALFGNAPAPVSAPRRLEDLARPRADLDPAMARAASKFDDNLPDWDLDVGAGKTHEPIVASSPGTLITDFKPPREAAAPPEAREPAPSPAPPAPSVAPPIRQPLFGPGDPEPRPVSAKPLETPPGPRPAPGPPGPVPSTAPPAAARPAPRPAAPSAPPPAPPPLPNVVGPRLPAPRETTAAQKLPLPPKETPAAARPAPATPAAPPPAESESWKAVLAREVNRRWVWAIVGLAALAGAVTIGVMLHRRSAITQSSAPDEETVRETAEKRRLLEEGNRLLAAGKAADARKVFLDLVRRAPDSGAARRSLQKAEALLAEQAGALRGGVPAGSARAPAHDLNLRITFTSPFSKGFLLVQCNEKEVFRKSFDFGARSSGGPVQGEAEVPAGPAEFKVWVIASNSSVREYSVLKTDVPDGVPKTLMLDLDPAKGLTAVLR